MESEPDTEQAIPAVLPVTSIADMEMDMAGDMDLVATGVDFNSALDVNHLLGIDTGADTDPMLGIKIDTGADTDTMLGIKIDTGADTDAMLGAKIDTGADTDTMLGIKIDTGADTDAMLGAKIDTGADTDTMLGIKIDTGADTDAMLDIKIDTSTDTDTMLGIKIDTGADTDTMLGIEIDTGADTDAMLSIKIDTGTDTDTMLGIKIDTGADTDAMLGVKIDTGADTDAMLGVKIDTGADTDAMLGIKIDTGADTDAMFGSSTTGLLEESLGGVDMSCSQSSETSSDVLLGVKTDDTCCDDETPFMSTRPSALSLQDNTSDLFPVDFPSGADDSNITDVITAEDSTDGEKVAASAVVGSAETKGDASQDYSLTFKESGISAMGETNLSGQVSSPAEMEEPCFNCTNTLECPDGNSAIRVLKDDVMVPSTKCDESKGIIDPPKGGNDSNLRSPAVEHLLIATGEPLPKVVPRKRKQVAAAGTRRSSRLKQPTADEDICLESRTDASEGDSVNDEDVLVSGDTDALKQDDSTKDNPSGDALVETVQVPEKPDKYLDDDVTLSVHRNTHNVSRRGRTKKLGQGRKLNIECTAIADPHVQTSIECSPDAPMLDEEKDLATDGEATFPEIGGTENLPDAPMLDKEKDSAVETGASSELVTTEWSPDAPMLDNEKNLTVEGEQSPNTVDTASGSSVVSVSLAASGESDHGKTNTSEESHIVSDGRLTVDANIITDKLDSVIEKPTESQQETKTTSSSEGAIMVCSEHTSTIIPSLPANELQDSVVEDKLEISTEITPEPVIEGTSGVDDESIAVALPPPRANVARRGRPRRRGRPASMRGAKRQRMMATAPDTQAFTDSSSTVDNDSTIDGIGESQDTVALASGGSSTDAYVSMCVTGECDRSKINPSEDSQDMSSNRNVTPRSSVSPHKLEEPTDSLEFQPESDVTPNSEDTVMVSSENKDVTVSDSATDLVDSVVKDRVDNAGQICSEEVENTASDSGQAQRVDEQEMTSNMDEPSATAQSCLASMESGDSNDTVDYSGELLDINGQQLASEEAATTGPVEGISRPEDISLSATSEECNTMADVGINEEETEKLMSSIGSGNTLVSNSDPAVITREASASGELAASSGGTLANFGGVTIEGQVSHVLTEIVTAIENRSGVSIVDTGRAMIDNSSDVTATEGDSNPTAVPQNDSQQAAPGKAMTVVVGVDGGSSSNLPVSPGSSLSSDGPLQPSISQGPPGPNDQPRIGLPTPVKGPRPNPHGPVKALLGLKFPTAQLESPRCIMPRPRFCGPSCEMLHYGGPCQAQIRSCQAPFEDPSQPHGPGPRDDFLHSGPGCHPPQQDGSCPRPDYQTQFEGPSQPCRPQPRFRGPCPGPDGRCSGPNSQPQFEGPSQQCGPRFGGPGPRPDGPCPEPDYQPPFEGPSQPYGPQPRFRGPAPRPDGPCPGPDYQPHFEGPSQPCGPQPRFRGPRPRPDCQPTFEGPSQQHGPQPRFRGPAPRPDGPCPGPDYQPQFEGPSQQHGPQHRFRGPAPRPDGPCPGPDYQPQFEGHSQPCGPQPRFRGPGPIPDGPCSGPYGQSQFEGPSQPRFGGPGPRPNSRLPFEGPSQPCGPRFRGPCPRPDGPPCDVPYSEFEGQTPNRGYCPGANGPRPHIGAQSSPPFKGPRFKTPFQPAGFRPNAPDEYMAEQQGAPLGYDSGYNSNWSEQQGGPPGHEPEYNTNWSEQQGGPPGREPEYNTNWSEQQGGPPGHESEYNTNWSEQQGGPPGHESEYNTNWSEQQVGAQFGRSFTKTPLLPLPGAEEQSGQNDQPPFEGPSQPCGPQPRFRGPGPRPDGPRCGFPHSGPPQHRGPRPDDQPPFPGPSQPRGLPRFYGPRPRPDGPPCDVPYSELEGQTPNRGYCPGANGPRTQIGAQSSPPFKGPRFETPFPPAAFRPNAPDPSMGAAQLGGSLIKTPLLPLPGAEEQSGQIIGHEQTASDIGSQPGEIAMESCPTEAATPDKGTELEPKADSTELKSTEVPASVAGDESQETKPSEATVKTPLLATPVDYADVPPPGCGPIQDDNAAKQQGAPPGYESGNDNTNWVELQMAPPGCESENNTNWSELQGPPPGCKPEYNTNWSQQQGPPPGYDAGHNTNWSQPQGPPPGYDSGYNTNWSQQQGPPPGYAPESNNWSEQQGQPPGWRQPSGPPPHGMGPPPQQGMGPPQQGMGPRGPPQQGMGPRGPPQQGMGPPGVPPPQGSNGPRGPPPDWYSQSYTQESPQGWGYPPQQYQQPYWYGGNYNDYYNNYYQWYYSGYGQSQQQYAPTSAWSPPNEWSVAANSLAAVAAASTAESNTATSIKADVTEDLVVSTVSNRPMSSIPLPAVNQVEPVTSWPPKPPKAQRVPKPALLTTPVPQTVPPPKLTALTATHQAQKPTAVRIVPPPPPPPPVSQPAPPRVPKPVAQHIPTPVPQRVVPTPSAKVTSPPPAISLPTPFAALQGIGGKSVRYSCHERISGLWMLLSKRSFSIVQQQTHSRQEIQVLRSRISSQELHIL